MALSALVHKGLIFNDFFGKSNALREWPCQYIWALVHSMGIKRLKI
jgi:hypothetical protein